MPSTEKRSINRCRQKSYTNCVSVRMVAECKKSHISYEKLFAAIKNQINDLTRRTETNRCGCH
ncbi:hypothetical protein PROFUN_03878 [Planoprotostelium fungivorum]|uniref:Uncharacterized protein n=1 Tax=Planoprotostelium fungivorum TaxID=1890364 RepID=A0A2P6MTK2_9EUKA|nr:hypothetical protein PROFUN_03878 [Planoprotostelium fungivorum]